MLRVIARNIVSNWAAFAVHVAVTLFLTPFILHNLGLARYGIWALATGLIGYYGLLDFGLRAGMTQYLTRYLATKDFARMNAIASTGFVALACCGVLVAAVTLFVTWLIPSIDRIPQDVTAETQWCVLILGLSTAVQFGFHTFAAVFPATQRFDSSNGVVIGTRLLGAGAVFTALKFGYGLVALSIITAVVGMILYGTLWRLAYRVLPELDISPRLAERESFRPIINHGFWSFFIHGAHRLKTRVDIFLIPIFLPINAVAPYVLALSMAEYLGNMFTPIGYVFFPVMTELDARGDASRLKKAFLVGSKMLMLLAIAAGALSVAWAADFFLLWVGPGVTGNGTYPSPAALYCLLAIPCVCTASQQISQQVCLGTRRMASLSTIVACEVVLRIAFSVLLVQRFGLIGIALGTILPTVIFQMILLPANVCRILGIKGTDYFRETCIRPLLTLVALVCLLGPIMYVVSGVTSWLELFLFATLTGVIVSILLFLIGLDRTERRRFVLEPLLYLGRRVRWFNSSEGTRSDEPSTNTLDSVEVSEP